MKKWFKYEYGFVNIDEDNIYLTNSGNWSDTKDLRELSPTHKSSKNFAVILGLILIVVLVILLNIFNVLRVNMSIGLIVFTLAGGFAIYNYMRTEIGANFMIPEDKIINVERIEKDVLLTFLDIDYNETTYLLKNVKEEDYYFLYAYCGIEE